MQRSSTEKIVLDAWAMLALIFGEEPAASVVKAVFQQHGVSRRHVYMSWINLGELSYILARKKGLEIADDVLKDINLLPITLNEPKKADILDAALIKARHRVSYADAFAISLANRLNGTLYTGDPGIVSLQNVVKLKRLSRKS